MAVLGRFVVSKQAGVGRVIASSNLKIGSIRAHTFLEIKFMLKLAREYPPSSRILRIFHTPCIDVMI